MVQGPRWNCLIRDSKARDRPGRQEAVHLHMEGEVRNFLTFLAEGGSTDASSRAFAFVEDELCYVGPDCPAAWTLLHSADTSAAIAKGLQNPETADCATMACHQIMASAPVCKAGEIGHVVREPLVQERLVKDLGRTDLAFASRMAALSFTAVAANGFLEEVIGIKGLLDAVADSVAHQLEHQPSGEEAQDEMEVQGQDTIKPCMDLLVALMTHSEDAVQLIAAHERVPALARLVACTYGTPSMIGEFYSMLEYLHGLHQATGTVIRLCAAQLPRSESAAYFLALRDGLEEAERGKTNADEWNKKVRTNVLMGIFPEEDAKARDHLLDDACA